MELRHKGVLYSFDYDFAPNDETNADCPEWTPIADGHGLEGSIHVHSITLNGKPRPVTTEVLALMERAAAISEFTYLVEASIDLYQKAGIPLTQRQLQCRDVVSRLSLASPQKPQNGPATVPDIRK